MPKPKINGSLLPQLKSVKIKFDPSNGTTTTQEFESAGDNLTGLAKQFATQGASYDLVSNPVRSSLVAVSTKNIFTPSEEVLERWELFSNQQQLDLKESAGWASLSDATRAQVLKDVERHSNGTTITGARSWGTVGSLSTADSYYQLMIRGTTHYIFPQWVIRVTCNVSNEYQNFVEADGGVGTIYTTAQLGTPAGRLRSTIQSITAPAANDYLTYGWLKVSYTEVTAARNRVDVSNELWLGQWATILYS
jgi:hypothetical protein